MIKLSQLARSQFRTVAGKGLADCRRIRSALLWEAGISQHVWRSLLTTSHENEQ